MKRLYVLIALLASTCTMLYGQEVSKERKLSGNFSADKGNLVIDNRYGSLSIKTWDKKEVTVEITITAKASSAEKAQELLDRVSITEPTDKAAGIYYKTVIEKSTITDGSFRIDYVINMPRRQTAKFIDKYGDINISNVEGKLDIDLQYGNLQTASISGNNKDISVRFGSATITSIETGTIHSSYSKLSIEKGGDIHVTNEFGNTTIRAVQNLDIDQKYNDLTIGSVNQLNGTVQYASLSIEKLLKSTQMTLKYCSHAQFDYIGPDVNAITIHSNFSNLAFHFDRAASLLAEMDVAFGNVKSDVNGISFNEMSNSLVRHSYKTKIGNGRGNMSLNVSYGNVVFK